MTLKPRHSFRHWLDKPVVVGRLKIRSARVLRSGRDFFKQHGITAEDLLGSTLVRILEKRDPEELSTYPLLEEEVYRIFTQYARYLVKEQRRYLMVRSRMQRLTGAEHG